ncbi:hypothetical protein MLD38_004948 [Melastoma candidum]|uniref:Uncharacterized protein n=1 Tax=Melastoma candidum TaxID=119954 RepID=A0ACB9S715_9MYRT|nr:hypothetical protein MLD38_004948 [Melastoma candidum]
MRGNSDSDEDDSFFYRYPSAPQPPSLPQSDHTTTTSSYPRKASNSRGSGGLAPSKSTLYVSNLDFSLTNSDLHVLFSHFGPIARVTVLKDPLTRASRGVAFVQFVSASDARKAAGELEGKILNGRKIRASIAKDNGRAAEFIRKRVYKDKSRCYECGEEGHLSYECSKNVLGPRERPAQKKGRKGGGGGSEGRGDARYGEERDEQVFEEESWAAAVDGSADERLLKVVEDGTEEEGNKEKKEKEKRASYFSDESEEDD